MNLLKPLFISTLLFYLFSCDSNYPSNDKPILQEIYSASGRDGEFEKYMDLKRNEKGQIIELEVSFKPFGKKNYLSPGLAKLKTIETLRIRFNGDSSVTDIPTFISHLPNLKDLTLSGADMVKSWNDSLEFPLLEIFTVAALGVYEIPYFLKKSANLKNLTFQKTNLKSLPDWPGFYANLENMDFRYNQLEEIPAEVFNTGAERITLENNNITQFPELPFKNTRTVKIFLNDNKISQISRGFLQFQNLKAVYLGDNLVEDFPENFCEFEKHLFRVGFPDAQYLKMISGFECY